MKKMILMLVTLIVCGSSFGEDFSGGLGKTLETMTDCHQQGTFWELQDTSLGYFVLRSGLQIPMAQVTSECQGDICPKTYRSTEDRLPTYEIVIPSIVMSSLPRLIIAYSGVMHTCSMTYIDEDELLKNVGSLGHGQN